MKVRHLFLAAALPAAIVLVGCGPTTSGTGGTKTEVTKADSSKTTVDESFKISGPPGSPYGIKQGETKSLEFKVDKAKDMHSDVEVTVESPDKDKVTVEAVPAKVPASGDGKFAIKVTAKDDAPLGEHTVKLSAKSDKGNPVVADFKVKVDKK